MHTHTVAAEHKQLAGKAPHAKVTYVFESSAVHAGARRASECVRGQAFAIASPARQGASARARQEDAGSQSHLKLLVDEAARRDAYGTASQTAFADLGYGVL